jgi:magnesium and cobalt transporter
MIVEQILGEIEDEHDSVEGEREILLLGPNSYRIKGHCRLSQFNTILGLEWTDNSIETVGGFLVKFLGRIPIIGEILDFEKVKIEIINSDSRKINLILITLK